jgi:hypothetical protein
MSTDTHTLHLLHQHATLYSSYEQCERLATSMHVRSVQASTLLLQYVPAFKSQGRTVALMGFDT